MNKQLWASAVAALMLSTAGAVQAQSYSAYGTVVDVMPIRSGGSRQVCEPNYRNDGYGYSYSQGSQRYDDRGYDRYPRQEAQVGGAIAGALIGGVLGNQVGSGSGRTAATVGGALLGGWAGKEIGQNTIPRDYSRDSYAGQQYNGYAQGQRCWTEYQGNGRVSSYEVKYRLDGRMFTTQLPYAPPIGSRIRVENPRW